MTCSSHALLDLTTSPSRSTWARPFRLMLLVGFCSALPSCGFSLREPGLVAPDEAAAALDRADQLRAQGFREQALIELERAIEINPSLTTAYVGIGDIHREVGDYVAAERSYSTAAQLEPQNFDAQYRHGLTLHLLNRVADAVRAYLRALAVQPGDFDANLNVASAYLQLGEPRQALAYAERAVRLNLDSGPAHANLGAALAGLGRHDEAVAQYQQAAERMELTPELLLNLADSLGRAGRYAEMANTLDQLIKVAPSAAAYERLGSSQFRQQQYDEALATFRKAIELDPAHYPALNGVGVSLLNRYIWSDRTDGAALEEARAVFRRSLLIERRQPKIVDLLSRYG